MPANVDDLTARLHDLFERSTPEEQEVLTTLFALAAWAPDPSADGAEVEGFGLHLRRNIGGNVQAQDRLGNFEIQDLMSQYNQAQSLASNVLKKQNDTTNGIIGKI